MGEEHNSPLLPALDNGTRDKVFGAGSVNLLVTFFPPNYEMETVGR